MVIFNVLLDLLSNLLDFLISPKNFDQENPFVSEHFFFSIGHSYSRLLVNFNSLTYSSGVPHTYATKRHKIHYGCNLHSLARQVYKLLYWSFSKISNELINLKKSFSFLSTSSHVGKEPLLWWLDLLWQILGLFISCLYSLSNDLRLSSFSVWWFKHLLSFFLSS